MTLPPFGPGPTAIPPKLPVADGIVCCALNGPQTPRPVTGAPRATMFPFAFQSTQTLPLPTAIEGWSTLPLPAVTGALNVTPPSVLKITFTWSTLSLKVHQEQVAEGVPGRLSVTARHTRGDRAAHPARTAIC